MVARAETSYFPSGITGDLLLEFSPTTTVRPACPLVLPAANRISDLGLMAPSNITRLVLNIDQIGYAKRLMIT